MEADIDLFIRNFKELWKSGRSAHLNLDAHAGEAWIGLRVRLGHTGQRHHHHQHEGKTRDSPSRQRRRLRRAAAREKAAEEAAIGTEGAEKAASNVAIDENVGSTEVTEEVTNNVVETESEFSCNLCEFRSKWENGIKIHMARKHSRIEQLDGNTSVNDASEEDDEKYKYVKHYLHTGWLGGAYQTFLDAMDIINESDLNEELKVIEKEKVLTARKLALGENFSWFPPWDSS